MWIELSIYSSALVGVQISLCWVAAERRGVAFFKRDENGAPKDLVDGEGSTGLLPPVAMITTCLTVMTVIANIDDRFNGFAR